MIIIELFTLIDRIRVIQKSFSKCILELPTFTLIFTFSCNYYLKSICVLIKATMHLLANKHELKTLVYYTNKIIIKITLNKTSLLFCTSYKAQSFHTNYAIDY